jgi:hypothetical protein
MNTEAQQNLKDQAEALLLDESATPAVRAQAHLMRIEAYYSRELNALKKKAPSLELYGSNYLAANRAEIDPEALAILDQRFPVCTRRMIETGFSGWDSYGRHIRFSHFLEQKQAV